MTARPTEPKDILQDLIDRQAEAMLYGSQDVLLETMSLPYRRTFLNHDTLIETSDDLAADFGAFTNLFRGLGVNQCISLVSDAEILGQDHVAGHFVTHILRNGVPLLDSFVTRAVAQNSSNTWRLKVLETFLTVYEYPFKVVRVPFKGPGAGVEPEDDVRRSSMTALAIYERYLGEIARTLAEERFDEYCDLHIFPYSAHGAQLDQEIASPADLRPFYNTLRRCHDGTVGDRIERIADRAEFIGPDLICGYHVGRVFLGDQQTVDDVQSRMILQRTGAKWRLKTVANSINNAAYPFSMYEPGGTLKTHLEIQKRTKS